MCTGKRDQRNARLLKLLLPLLVACFPMLYKIIVEHENVCLFNFVVLFTCRESYECLCLLICIYKQFKILGKFDLN